MGKQGPCCHCGVTSTPLWRNGPPNKPVLCNACGSRWRTKGTLVNYAPLHVRGYASIELQSRNSYERVRPLNNTKLELVHVTKTKPDVSQVTDQIKDNLEAVPAIHKKDACSKCSEEDTGNRSTSASGKSYSESSVQFDDTDGNETTGDPGIAAVRCNHMLGTHKFHLERGHALNAKVHLQLKSCRKSSMISFTIKNYPLSLNYQKMFCFLKLRLQLILLRLV